MILGIDLSMRSSGLVVLEPDASLHAFSLLKTDKDTWEDDRDLLLYVEARVLWLLQHCPGVTHIFLEGLSFAGKSAKRDVIDGLHWHLRAELRRHYPDVALTPVPVTTWRSRVLDKQQQRDAKAAHKTRGLKEACVRELPAEVQRTFKAHVKTQKFPPTSVYDLTDAYWIARYGLDKTSKGKKTPT